MNASESGGQRARINLARALYSDADLYLLDDPLAAVDTKVVNNLYHNAITNQLADKTRILVTHHVSLLRNADVIICINNKPERWADRLIDWLEIQHLTLWRGAIQNVGEEGTRLNEATNEGGNE